MDPTWNDSQPIYRQLRDKVVDMILEGQLTDGDATAVGPKCRRGVSLNPLTVLKGYQQLVDEGLVEKRRGRGMFVTEAAGRSSCAASAQRFLEQEWPRVLSTISSVWVLDVGELLGAGECHKRKSGV